ncbi:MAG: ABC transporter ATP-binding protein [Kaiparowitsia implicata GSE-PSE-MK54-09C]|jgi:ABC-type Fe3+/spermidine/putrescine transport system ATPase subunit|nr:ABC transporter ATP-binding protein [Kaiparowitsia implicata GSE-PSE-MK54-09C]
MAFTNPATLQFQQVSYGYGPEEWAVDDINLVVKPGELVVLVGPSGCGKSTLLKLVAGLIYPTRGTLLLDDMNVARKPPEQRQVGWVPQSYALFDHLTVAENIAFGLRMQGQPRQQRQRRTEHLLDLCQIQALARRSVHDLSGGQRQRVAIARALAVQPRVLLLDEPLAALDPQLRVSLRSSLVSLLREAGVTTLFVTHDQTEALAIADRIAVLRAGRVEQYGNPETLWDRPVNEFVARFLSRAEIVEAHYVGGNQVEIVPGLIAPIAPQHLNAHRNAHTVTLALRPTDLQVDSTGVMLVVLASEYTGSSYLVYGQLPNGPRLSFMSSAPVQPGETVPVQVRPEAKVAIISA